jgi:hypothetical protein
MFHSSADLGPGASLAGRLIDACEAQSTLHAPLQAENDDRNAALRAKMKQLK